MRHEIHVRINGQWYTRIITIMILTLIVIILMTILMLMILLLLVKYTITTYTTNIRSYHSSSERPTLQRIEYKVLLLTYKAVHGKAPAYISQLLSLYTPTRPLRSENKNLLRVPRCRLEGFGRRCFAYAAPSLWNPLPTPVKCASSIETFKSSLKTYLFNVAYPSIH